MRNALAYPIIDCYKTAVGFERGFYGAGQEAGGGEERRDVIRGQGGQGFEVRAGNEQAVAGKERTGVQEGEHVRGFVDLGGGEGSSGNPAKNARSVRHGFHDAPAGGVLGNACYDGPEKP
jgi:hypothetical protein